MSAELQTETMPTADELSLSACEAIYQSMAPDTEAREDLKTAEIPEDNNRESTPSDTSTELAPEPTPITAPSREEDTRVAELRRLYERFQEWLEKACDCPVIISVETILYFQLTILGSIAFVEEREEYVKDFERINDRLLRQFKQQHHRNHQVQAEYLQMQRRMKFLERENESLKVKCDELERCTASTMSQKENRNLLEATAATEWQDLTAIAGLRAEDTVVVEADVHATEAKTRHETKSSEHSPSRKKFRLN